MVTVTPLNLLVLSCPLSPPLSSYFFGWQEDPCDAGEAHFPHLDTIEGNEDADLSPESVCEVAQVSSVSFSLVAPPA